MWRMHYVCALAFVLCLTTGVQSAQAFLVNSEVQFDANAQQFYVRLRLEECPGYQRDGMPPGNLTRYLTIPGLDRYTASREYRWLPWVMVRGPFQPRTTYTISVDGAICERPGTGQTKVTFGAYPPAIEFLSKGLYFSKIEPYLRFRYREVSTISWAIYRISKENRYLFSRTQGLQVYQLQTTGEAERLAKTLQSLSYLEDYPGQRFATVSHLQHSAEWQVQALDLTPYYKEGDWVVIVASVPQSGDSAAGQETANTETDSETSAGGEGEAARNTGAAGQRRAPVANTVLQFTNLGVYVRQNDMGLWGQTIALDAGTPVFAAVFFKQRNGEVLHRTDTDVQGRFHLPAQTLAQIKPQLHRVEAIRGEDSVEIFLQEGAIPLREFPITGADHRLPLQAFIYSDRGLYRLGETVHLTALVRRWDLTVPQDDLTAELSLAGPSGRVKQVTLPGADFQNGATAWSWAIPHDVKTGSYRAEVQYQGAVIGVGTFAVEQIIPPTMEAEVHLQEPSATWDPQQARLSAVTGTVAARFLFGAPAAGKKWEYRCVLEAGELKLPQYEGFVFHDALRAFQPLTFVQQEGQTLDRDGKGAVDCTQSQQLAPDVVQNTLPGAGSIKVVVDVFEEGGRSVQASQAIPGYFHPVYPGVRPRFAGDLRVGQAATFQLVAVDPNTGQAQAGVPLKIELYEKDYASWYYFHRRDEPFVESEITRILRLTEEVVSGTEPVSYSVALPGCCEWELRVSVGTTAAASRVAFRNGWWWQQDTPGGWSPLAQKVTLRADKEQYTVGETARVLITAPFDGVLVLLHEKDGQPVHTDTVAVVNKTAEYQFQTTQVHSPWFHLNAILLRTVQAAPSGFQAKRETPYRALGMLPIQVHAPEDKLTVSLEAPPQVLPDSTLALTIRAQDTNGQNLPGPTWLTVAVVDEGILQLGRFTTPDPYAGLHRRPAYPNAWYDTLGQVVPYSLHRGESAFGGDASLERSAVERVKPMAWWSGMVHTDASGVLRLDVPVPDYTGRVRIMAVGWQAKRTGSAQAQTLVFAPVDLLTSLPRVLGVFDRSQAVAEVLNNTDRAQTVTVSASTKGPLHLATATAVTMTVQLPARQSTTVRWELVGGGVPGKAEVTFLAQSADGVTRKRSTELFMRPPGVPLTLVTPFLVQGGAAYQVPVPEGVDFARGTGQWEVVLSTSPAAKIAKHVQYLVGYPHGCVEQTTSQLFAMLLLKPTLGPEVLSTVLDTKRLDNIDAFLEAGVRKLSRLQMADGGFTFWLGGSTQYSWLNAYVTHFLWKARQLGYAIPDEMYSKALQKLQSQFTGSQAAVDPDVLSYSAFVLALHGQVSRADLQWLVSRLQDPSRHRENTTLAVAHALARGTMLQLRQPAGALQTLRGLPEVTLDMPAIQWWRTHRYLSREAAFAAQLYTRALADDASVGSPLQLLLEKIAQQSYVSTHTIAWALLAVDSVFPALSEAVRATVTIPGGAAQAITTAPGENRVSGPLPPDVRGAFTVTNTSPNHHLFGYMTYRGWPARPPQNGFSQHLEVRRLYLEEAGNLLLPPFTVKQGQRLFVALLARHTVEGVAHLTNVAIEDWLPAGLELENLRLLDTNALPALPEAWHSAQVLQPDYVDYLDDKITVFGTLSNDVHAFIFPVRAVSQGTFQLMPSTGEAMYMPDVRTLEVEASQITITAPNPSSR